ncbi:hypothetical protein RF11_09035 [Thelohanellus kitauei]|uniref:Uncharacterized protein n=1 Tax=Thelohanellus kitauei TaxID=669202 RepID=A0A0C2MTQ8_THEKT|nr:hypothetical protein RF11_09035 [Thelohanellus kitauei]
MESVKELITLRAYYQKHYIEFCKGDSANHLDPVRQRGIEDLLRRNNFAYSDLPLLLKEVFTNKELTPGQFDHLRHKLRKVVVDKGSCNLASYASYYFVWPEYFIRGLFDGPERYKKNVISVLCSLKM